MNNNEIKSSDIEILPAGEVNTEALIDFYKSAYPGSLNITSWEWLYRTCFCNNKMPLVVYRCGRVIGHAGIMPFTVTINGEHYAAAWFTDFIILPEFQRKGLGSLLLEKWSEKTDIGLAVSCSDSSYQLFKNNSWRQSFDTYFHYFHIASRPGGALKLKNFVKPFYCAFLAFIYRQYSYSINRVLLEPLNKGTLDNFISLFSAPNSGVIPIRDLSYLSWRLLSSPDLDKYSIFSIKDNILPKMIIKFSSSGRVNFLDVLLISDLSRHSEIIRMISTLAAWSKKVGYSHIRYYTSSHALSAFLKRYLYSRVGNPRFLFFSKNHELFNNLTDIGWNWELIDSDFEWN